MELQKLTLQEWNELSEVAHLICFNEKRAKEINTFDFCLFISEDDIPMAYATCIELDKKSVYMQHGGAMPSIAKSIDVTRGYKLMLSYLKENYQQASTRIKNDNIPMIKLALHHGFIINGLDCYSDGETYLHLINKFGGNSCSL